MQCVFDDDGWIVAKDSRWLMSCYLAQVQIWAQLAQHHRPKYDK